MQFERRLGGLTAAAAVPVVGPTAAVASAAFDQQTSGEEDGVGGPQLLAQVDGVVARSTAVPLDVVIETVQIDWMVREEKGEKIGKCLYLRFLFAVEFLGLHFTEVTLCLACTVICILFC